MKNQRKYIDVPTVEEIKKQYKEILELTKDITTFEQIQDFTKNNSDTIEVEVNWDSLSCYKGEKIEVIRYEYKNILVYVDIVDGKAKPSEIITLYSDEGLQFGDLSIDKIEEEIERVAKMGLLEENNNFNKYKIVLHHVELEEGLNKVQIINLLDKLEEDDNGYIPIEFSANNSSAYGFITSSYYEELSFDNSSIAKVIEPVLENWNNEREDKLYKLEDEIFIYMDCDCKTI